MARVELLRVVLSDRVPLPVHPVPQRPRLSPEQPHGKVVVLALGTWYKRDNCSVEVKVDTIPSHIEVTPGISGDKPRIAGHRITVQHIIIWHERLGLSADEIATEYGLSLADVYAALAYYYDHHDEIDRAIRSDEEFIANLIRRTPSKLSAKLGG
jgi:uncharacterized protein (DUF433 family)